jgi:hypothetical protein
MGRSHPFEGKIFSQTTSFFALTLQFCPWFWVGPELLLLLHDFGLCNCCDSLPIFLVCLFVGSCSRRDRDYCIQSNFWKFYLIRTDFTVGEPVSLVKVFRQSKLEFLLSPSPGVASSSSLFFLHPLLVYVCLLRNCDCSFS